MSSRDPKDTQSESDYSISSSESRTSESKDIEDVLLEEPMYYVLEHFLETETGKNIATVLQELVCEMRSIKELLMKR